MLCCQCKTEIPDGSQCCLSCGAKQPEIAPAKEPPAAQKAPRSLLSRIGGIGLALSVGLILLGGALLLIGSGEFGPSNYAMADFGIALAIAGFAALAISVVLLLIKSSPDRKAAKNTMSIKNLAADVTSAVAEKTATDTTSTPNSNRVRGIISFILLAAIIFGIFSCVGHSYMTDGASGTNIKISSANDAYVYFYPKCPACGHLDSAKRANLTKGESASDQQICSSCDELYRFTVKH